MPARFEYKVTYHYSNGKGFAAADRLSADLNRVAKDGWGLVDAHTEGQETRFIWVRPVPPVDALGLPVEVNLAEAIIEAHSPEVEPSLLDEVVDALLLRNPGATT